MRVRVRVRGGGVIVAVTPRLPFGFLGFFLGIDGATLHAVAFRGIHLPSCPFVL